MSIVKKRGIPICARPQTLALCETRAVSFHCYYSQFRSSRRCSGVAKASPKNIWIISGPKHSRPVGTCKEMGRVETKECDAKK